MSAQHDDDDLAARLRAIDPARSAARLTEQELIRMSNQSTASVRRSRRPVVITIGAIAGAVAVGAVVFALTAPGPVEPVALTLTESDPATSMCMALSPQSFDGADLAVDAVVVEVGDGLATLDVTRGFTPDAPTRITLPVPDAMATDFSFTGFEQGGRYLVAASDGVVLSCGASGEYSPELEQLYDEAF